MKRGILVFSFVSFLSAEPSAFMAGDLDSPNPYGLTKDEKYILQNKKNIQQLNLIIKSQKLLIIKQAQQLNKINIKFLDMKLKVDSLTQTMEGIKSILSSTDVLTLKITNLNNKIESLKQELNSTNLFVFNLKDEFNTLTTNVNNIKNIVNKNHEISKNNTDTLIALVEKLAQNLDKIQNKITKLNKKSDFRTLSNIKIYDEAVKEFKKSLFTKAKIKFNYLYEKKYRTSVVLFYLGEINYKRGDYNTALSYYKNSIKEDSKSQFFTPELLYHTGYSFEKLGKKEYAKKSYLKLITDYPKSIFVKYSKNRIKNLEKKQ